MLKLIEHKRLPKGTGKAVAEIRKDEQLLNHRDVVQIDEMRSPTAFKHFESFRHSLPTSSTEEPGFLMFRDVGEHDDEWPDTRHNGKRVAPAFAHLVIHGRMRLRVGRKVMDFRAGDLFVMDMNKPHAVESRSLCITAVVTVPRLLYA